MNRSTLKLALLSTTLVAGMAHAKDATLIIESWRNDDLTPSAPPRTGHVALSDVCAA